MTIRIRGILIYDVTLAEAYRIIDRWAFPSPALLGMDGEGI